MSADRENQTLSRFDRNLGWWTFNGGGPIVPNRVFFYGSFYRPTAESREPRQQVRRAARIREHAQRRVRQGDGDAAPIGAHQRQLPHTRNRLEKSDLFLAHPKPPRRSAGTGNEAWLKIGIAEGSWVIDSRSYLTFKFTHFTNLTQGRPDNIADVAVSTDVGTRLDLERLDQLGQLTVPTPVAGQAAFNTFIQPLIDRYGYHRHGDGVRNRRRHRRLRHAVRQRRLLPQRRAGGLQPARSAAAIVARAARRLSALHRLRRSRSQLERLGRDHGAGRPARRDSRHRAAAFYTAAYSAADGRRVCRSIHSEYHSQNFEVNDTIRWNDVSFNVGVHREQRHAVRPGASRRRLGRCPDTRSRSATSTRCTKSRSAR